MDKIKHIDELLKDYVGPKKTIVNTNVTNLIAPGENYLSNIQKIDVTLKNNETGQNENLHIVGKSVCNFVFGTTAHFNRNELEFYKYIVPAIHQFQAKHGIPPANYFPVFVGGRNNLTGDKEPDRDGIILLENLKETGYEMQDRHLGFDLEGAKLILKDLANFHATGIALKLLEPEKFQNISEHCATMPPMPPPPEPSSDNPEGSRKSLPDFFPIMLEFLKKADKYSHIVPKFEKFYEDNKDLMKAGPSGLFSRPNLEPFCTLTHNDLWVNNTMQIVKNGVLAKNKFVDFQLCRIGSPVGDLIFFIITSIQSHVLSNHFDDLIRYYHEVFSTDLKKYGCYDAQFGYDQFLDEFKTNASLPILQCMFMIPFVIFAPKGKKVDMDNHKGFKMEEVPLVVTEKLGILLLEAGNRNWY